jgi:O-antigen ligase
MQTLLRTRSMSFCVFLFACSTVLFCWTVACVTDMNHPPGARLIRLVLVLFVLILGGIEYMFPWRGLSVFAFVWPLANPVREIASVNISSAFNSISDLWTGPTAAVFSIAILLRTQSAAKRCNVQPAFFSHSLKTAVIIARMALYALIITHLASALMSQWALFVAPDPSYNVALLDVRHLLKSQGTVLAPLLSTLDSLPCYVLSLVLLEYIDADKCGAVTGFRAFAVSLTAIALICGVIVLHQYAYNWHWEFDVAPPSGPFRNRNTTAPLLVLLVAAGLTAFPYFGNLTKAFYILTAAICTMAVFVMGSRNGILMFSIILCGSGFVYLSYFSFRTKLLAVLSGLLIFAILASSFHNGGLGNSYTSRRISDNVSAIRTGDLRTLTGGRHLLYKAAYQMWLSTPVFGSGPGTMSMIFHAESKYARLLGGDPVPAFGNIHSTLLQLFVECGVFSGASWILVWLLFPAYLIIRSKVVKTRLFGVLLLGAGAGTMFDNVWSVPGVALFMALLLGSIHWTCVETEIK